MGHRDHPRGAEATPSGDDRRDSAPRGHRAGGPRPIDSLVLATTDPIIAAEAEHQADWKRHPFATIRLETTLAGGPELMAVASPWAVDLEPMRRVAAKEPGPEAEPGPDAEPEPGRPAPTPDHREGDEGPALVMAKATAPAPAMAPSVVRRPRPGPARPRIAPAWAVVAAGLIGGVIGSVGYRMLAGSRRSDHRA